MSVAGGNCVVERRGGEQPEANCQSVIKKHDELVSVNCTEEPNAYFSVIEGKLRWQFRDHLRQGNRRFPRSDQSQCADFAEFLLRLLQVIRNLAAAI